MRIVTSKKFDKQFKKQTLRVKKQFRKRIEAFLSDMYDPSLNTHKLSGELQDLWSFNVTGDIRVIFDKSPKDVVLFVAIGSHSELYG